MKHLYTSVLIFALLFTAICPTFAHTSPSNTFFNPQYSYTYTKYTDSDGRTVCSYEKAETITTKRSSDTNDSISRTKSVLSDMGMSHTFIEALSPNCLIMYSNAEYITSITMFSKTDKNGNVTIVDEETARSQSKNINSSRVITFPEDFGNGEGSGETPDYYYDTEIDNNFMKITHTVSVLGNGEFHYSVDAEWLTTPSYRYYDSLGICVSNNQVINGTASGWTKYNRYTDNNTSPTLVTHSNYSNSIQQIVNGDWIGVGFKYLLPANDLVYSYDQFSAHFEFKGRVNNPTTESFFNTTATYDHLHFDYTITDISLILTPDLEVTLSGNDTYISLDSIFSSQTITVPIALPIHHVP